MCELCLSIVAVERYRQEPRVVAVESFRKKTPRKKSARLLLVASSFCIFFFLVRTQGVSKQNRKAQSKIEFISISINISGGVQT